MVKEINSVQKQKRKTAKKLPIFLVGMLVIYGGVALFDYELAKISLLEVIDVFLRIIPILMVVFVLMILSNLFLIPERVKRHFGKKSEFKGLLYSVVFGIIVVGPPYILYPMLKDLKKDGVSNTHLAVFLYNRNVKLSFIPAMVYYFGWHYTVILSVLIVVFSIFNGLLIGKVTK